MYCRYSVLINCYEMMVGGNGVYDIHTFLSQHKLQLENAGVPHLYWDCLFTKLTKQIFDAGEQFTLLQVGFRYRSYSLIHLFIYLVTC